MVKAHERPPRHPHGRGNQLAQSPGSGGSPRVTPPGAGTGSLVVRESQSSLPGAAQAKLTVAALP